MQLSPEAHQYLTYDTYVTHNLSVEPLIPEQFYAILRHGEAVENAQSRISIHSRFALFICLSGKGVCMIDGVSYQLQEDDAVISFPGQPHIRKPLPGCSAEWLLISFRVPAPPAWINLLRDKVIHLSGQSQTYLRMFIDSYQEADQHPRAYGANKAACSLGLLLSSMLEQLEADTIVFPQVSGGNKYVEQVCQLIVSPEFIGKPFKDIARHMNKSPGYLRAIFKKHTGQTPWQIIKLNRAFVIRHLLQHSELSITEIGEKLGFESVYSFSTYFRKLYGISPRQFRVKYRK